MARRPKDDTDGKTMTSNPFTGDLSTQMATKQINPLSLTLFFVITALGIATAVALDTVLHAPEIVTGMIAILFVLIALYVLAGLKIANEWEKAVVLRLGKFRGLRGPGLFWIIPIVDSIPTWIDHRVMVTPFAAEKTLTQDPT